MSLERLRTGAAAAAVDRGPRRRQPGPARPRRAVAQLQPQARRAVRRAARGGGEPAARTPRQRAASAAAPGCSSCWSLAVWLASGFYIVDEGQRGVVLRFGKFVETTHAGPALAPAVSDPVARDRQPGAGAHGRGRLPQQRQEQGAERIADADRRREHRRRAVRGAVHAEETRGLSVQQPRAPTRRVLQAAETAMREVVGKSSMDFVLYEGRERGRRPRAAS